MGSEFEEELRARALSLATYARDGAAAEAAETTAVLISPDAFWSRAIGWLVAAEGVRVVARAAELERALPLVSGLAADLLLIQTSPDLDPARLYRRLRHDRKARPGLRTVVLCDGGDSHLRDCALAGGATRVVEVERADSILAALRSLRAAADGPVERPLLTRRELEILRLVAEGRTNRDVAELLWVSDQTVKFHLANVYRKLGVSTRGEAITWARVNDVAGVAGAVAVKSPLMTRPHLPAGID
jgi:DNA-binding NarL/FixJ family response regulator